MRIFLFILAISNATCSVLPNIASSTDSESLDQATVYDRGGLKIISSRCQEMVQYIDAFPYSEYHIRQVNCYGYTGRYYIDSIGDAIKNCLEVGTPWEDHIDRLISQYARPGSTMLDIGAHIGTHTLTMAKWVGKKGKVLAFEPQPKIFRELFLNLQLNRFHNVSCYWAAVGDKKGKIETYFVSPGNEGATPLVATDISFGVWSCKVLGGTGEFVDLLTIDSLNLQNVSLIKIDVEGMENIVLDGAKETILRNKPVILIEIMGGWLPEIGPPDKIEQIDFTKRKLHELGYEVTRLGAGWDYMATPIKERSLK